MFADAHRLSVSRILKQIGAGACETSRAKSSVPSAWPVIRKIAAQKTDATSSENDTESGPRNRAVSADSKLGSAMLISRVSVFSPDSVCPCIS